MPKRKEDNKENDNPLSSSAKKAKSPIKMSSKISNKPTKSNIRKCWKFRWFSVFGEATELPALPNIHIKNIGPISFPIVDSGYFFF